MLLWVALPLVIAGLMGWYLLGARAAAGEFGFPLDDSWIHVRFAQHLVAGHGFSFNPGESTGLTTSPLWTLLLAACYALTHEYLFTSFVLNGVLAVLLCVLVYRLSLALHPSRWLALAAAAAVALTAPLPWWALSGMEPLLYADLALLAVLLHLRWRGVAGPRGLLPTVVMAFAALARPELLLLLPFALLDDLALAVWFDRESGGVKAWAFRWALRLPVYVLVVLPPFLYNHAVTGYWLPTSFYSKVQPDFARAQATGDWFLLAGSAAHELWSALLMWAHNNLVLFAPFLLGLWLIVTQARLRGARTASLLVPALVVLQPMVWALAGGYRPPEYQSQRYLAHLDVLYLLVGMYGGWWLTERIAALRTSGLRAVCVAGVLALSLVLQPDARTTYALNVKNITEMQVTLGRWLRDHTPKGALLAVNDVGAIGVIADRPVLDLQGLVTPEALPLRSKGLRQAAAGQMPTVVLDFVRSRRPAYLVIFPDWYREFSLFPREFIPVYGVVLRDNITCGASTMVVYRVVPEKRL